MRFEDPRIEWRINDVERKADNAARESYKADEAIRRVDSLEYTLRETSANFVRVCDELQAYRDQIQRLESRLEALEIYSAEVE